LKNRCVWYHIAFPNASSFLGPHPCPGIRDKGVDVKGVEWFG